MTDIANPREIIDRQALLVELEELVGWSGYTPKTQSQVLEIFKKTQSRGWNEVRRRFEDEGASSRDVVRANAYLVDQLIRSIYDFGLKSVYPAANPTTGELLSITATGGYGRGDLAPFSDIDLMFLLPYKLTAHSEQIVEYVLYTLWDLGLKVGHATRTASEAIRLAREDMTIRTSLLEARWLWGDKKMFGEFKKRFRSEITDGTGHIFVEAKLAERDNRHDRMGDTRYVLEPNIKEGKGGLRDLHTLFWIAKYLFSVDDVEGLKEQGVLTADDVKLFTRAEDFLWTVRCHLHYLSGRPEERLTFNIQNEISERMKYTDSTGIQGVEQFMKDYFLVAKDVGDLTRIICAVLEDQHQKSRRRFRLPGFATRKRHIEGFLVDGDRLNAEDKDTFRRHPVKILKLFYLAQVHQLDIHPNALRLVTQNLHLIDEAMQIDEEANHLFMDMLVGASPEVTLMRLNEAGVLGLFLPDFGQVVAQMQYDMYHVYTVDEHTIRAIGILKGIEDGRLKEDLPVSCSVIGEVQSLPALYVGVLLHDIAKGRGGDHSELGAEVALELGPRLGLSEWETETVSWLVRHHLLMSNTAMKRDLDDPKTVSDFAAVVQSPERLRLLLILTAADIRAVGPNVWNAWKAGLLRDLYYRALEELTGGLASERLSERIAHVLAGLRETLSDWPEDDIQAHLDRGHAKYWLSFNTDTLAHHANMIRDAHAKGLMLHIESRVEADRDVTEVIIYTQDHPGVFAAIAGAMSLGGASIVDAKIATLANGMALDTFWVQDSNGDAFADKGRLKRLLARIEDALSGRIKPARELKSAQEKALPSRIGAFKVPARVLIDNKASNSHTVIEINGRDRPGLLHDLTAALTTSGMQIASAHISTYGERVVDVFYIKDIFGLKVDNEEKIKALHASLLEIVSSSSASEQDPGQGKAVAKEEVKAAG
ncbi:MAG: [protein-PII] uridylyltransferase [Proteobacteria bacterium]|nr:[protein-PII] uridylyltransferase [Pseudomonadota bacterium]MDA1021800.1 [protein-PII] uridylyltransferase [Pseudomonadota bacterium]